MKTSGPLLAEFYNEWPLGDDWFCAGGAYKAVEDMATVAVVDVDEAIGGIFWKRSSDPPASVAIGGRAVRVDRAVNYIRPSAAFKAWRDSKRNAHFVVTVPIDDADALMALIGQRTGWKAKRS